MVTVTAIGHDWDWKYQTRGMNHVVVVGPLVDWIRSAIGAFHALDEGETFARN